MSEAPGPALGPETTLEGAPEAGPDRREQLSAALDALPESEAEAAPEASVAPAAAQPATDAPAAPEPTPYDKPPPSWSKEAHEAYAKADPAVREYIHKREEDMRRGVEPLVPKAKFADEVNGVISQFQGNLQASGVPPVQAIQSLMQADNILRNAPMDQRRAYAKQLLQQYGVDLSGEDWTQTDAPDPRLVAMQNELRQVQNTVTSFQQQQADQQNQALLAEVEAFRADKPHFEAVRLTMQQLLQSGQAVSFQDAYDKAMEPWAPVLTDAEAGRQAAAEAEKRKAADAAAKAARSAAVQVRSATPNRAPVSKATDRRSMLAEQLDGLSERV